MRHSRKTLILAGLSVFALAGCGDVKQELGITHPAPDEFTVLKRAPLSMPPDFALRPPQPGVPRPQDAVTAENARETVFGGKPETGEAAPTSADAILLKDTGADQSNPNIRQTIDRETAALPPKQKPVTERLLGWTHGSKPAEPPASVVDPVKEAERLKKDKAEGKPVTAGDTPVKEE
jgi:hypothetical protein